MEQALRQGVHPLARHIPRRAEADIAILQPRGAAQHEGHHALRVVPREVEREQRAHRVAAQESALEPQLAHQTLERAPERGGVAGGLGPRRERVEQPDDVDAELDEPPPRHVPQPPAGKKAGEQHHRRSARGGPRAFVPETAGFPYRSEGARRHRITVAHAQDAHAPEVTRIRWKVESRGGKTRLARRAAGGDAVLRGDPRHREACDEYG